MSDTPTVNDVRTSAHVAVLTAGPYVYVYAGADRIQLAERIVVARTGMIAANLDTAVTWLQPEHYHETHRRLIDAVGAGNVTLMPIDESEAAS